MASSSAPRVRTFHTLSSFSVFASSSRISRPVSPPSFPKPIQSSSLACRSVVTASFNRSGPLGGKLLTSVVAEACLGSGSSTANSFPSSARATPRTGCPGRKSCERPATLFTAAAITSSSAACDERPPLVDSDEMRRAGEDDRQATRGASRALISRTTVPV